MGHEKYYNLMGEIITLEFEHLKIIIQLYKVYALISSYKYINT